MKKIAYICLLLLMVASCKNNNVYKDLLKEEEKLIESFIKRNNIVVVEEQPEVWGENVHWKLPDYDDFYFHLVAQGDTAQPEVQENDMVLLRLKQYGLEAYTDTIYCWTTLDSPEPIKLQYMVASENSCTGWQLAIKYMKYTGAECKIICPSKLGFEEANSSVTPYGYDLKIKIKRY